MASQSTTDERSIVTLETTSQGFSQTTSADVAEETTRATFEATEHTTADLAPPKLEVGTSAVPTAVTTETTSVENGGTDDTGMQKLRILHSQHLWQKKPPKQQQLLKQQPLLE